MAAKNNIIRWKSTLWKCDVIIIHFLIQNNNFLLDQVFSFLTLIVKKNIGPVQRFWTPFLLPIDEIASLLKT